MYTAQDVIDYLSNTLMIRDTRKREYIDPRNYLIAIMTYQFKYTEMEVAKLFKIERSSVNHAKKHPYMMMTTRDVEFMTHAKEVIEKFPYDFPEPKGNSMNMRYVKKDQVTIYLDPEIHVELKNLASKTNHTLAGLLKKLILTSFKVMDRMSEEYKANPHYQNGYFWGLRTAKLIESTNYKSLENAIIVKEQLLRDFEDHFKWDMLNKDYAETRGTLDAFIDAKSGKLEDDEQRSNSERSS